MKEFTNVTIWYNLLLAIILCIYENIVACVKAILNNNINCNIEECNLK